MKGFSHFLILVGLVMWGLAFFFGPHSRYWSMGKPGVYLMALALFLYLLDYLIPSGKPKRRTRVRSETARKCTICGKPALSDSPYCSYHTKYGAENGDY